MQDTGREGHGERRTWVSDTGGSCLLQFRGCSTADLNPFTEKTEDAGSLYTPKPGGRLASRTLLPYVPHGHLSSPGSLDPCCPLPAAPWHLNGGIRQEA